MVMLLQVLRYVRRVCILQAQWAECMRGFCTLGQSLPVKNLTTDSLQYVHFLDTLHMSTRIQACDYMQLP